jgi:hypothetical protein
MLTPVLTVVLVLLLCGGLLCGLEALGALLNWVFPVHRAVDFGPPVPYDPRTAHLGPSGGRGVSAASAMGKLAATRKPGL